MLIDCECHRKICLWNEGSLGITNTPDCTRRQAGGKTSRQADKQADKEGRQVGSPTDVWDIAGTGAVRQVPDHE